MFAPTAWERAAFENPFFPNRLIRPHVTRAEGQDADKKAVHLIPRDDWLKQMMRAPMLDTVEQNDKLIVRIDVPGVKKEDVKVTLNPEGDHYVLIVSGERRDEFKGDQAEAVETRYGKFVRSVSLPKNIKPDGLVAKHEHGVLVISVPKVEPAAVAPIHVQIN